MVTDSVEFLSLVQAVDNMIERLSDTLLPSDQRHGWDEKGQAAMLGYYRDLRTRLGSGGPVKSSDIYGLGRGLNDLGVQGGELSDYACMICDELKDAKCLLEKEVAAVKSAAG